MTDLVDFMRLASTRRSIRRFTARRPTREQLERLIEAATWAPSNHNRQGWKFIVFDDPAEIARLAERTRAELADAVARSTGLARAAGEELLTFAGAFAAAPVVVLVMHKRPPAVGRELLAGSTNELASGEALSAAMAVQNLLLAAHAAGLGACVMTAPLLAGRTWSAAEERSPTAISRGWSLDLPAGFVPTCLVALGEAAESPPPPRRKSLGLVIEYRTAP